MTVLMPVANWTFHLYRVVYFEDADSEKEFFPRYIVSTDTHIEGEVCQGDCWPNSTLTYARWEIVEENVARPKQIGQLYGHRVDESSWSTGERMARKAGLLVQ